MRQALSFILTLAIVTRFASAVPDTATITTKIAGMPMGANVEVRLKDKQKLRGSRGAVSNTGFMLVDARGAERTVAFDDVASVKQVSAKSHTTRNVLIIAGIGVAAIGITLAILLRCGPLGCNSKL